MEVRGGGGRLGSWELGWRGGGFTGRPSDEMIPHRTSICHFRSELMEPVF